jgi:hypothetical protein
VQQLSTAVQHFGPTYERDKRLDRATAEPQKPTTPIVNPRRRRASPTSRSSDA